MRKCAARECRKQIAEQMVMCRKHWFLVPIKLRAKIWRLYRSDPGSLAHKAAINEAVRIAAEQPEQFFQGSRKET